MHHHQTLLFLLGALLTTTTTVRAGGVVGSSPYVHSFYNADCTGPDAGDTVHVEFDQCAKFDSVYDAVQVNFGTSLKEIGSLNVFSDDKCLVYAGKAVTSPIADGSPAVCVSQSAHGAKWGSVKAAT